MKSRKALLVLGGIILSMLVISVIIKSNQPNNPIAITAQAQDPKAEIKHQRREARYSAKLYPNSRIPGRLLSQRKEGGLFNVTHYDYIETKNLDDPDALTALQNEELTSRRKLVCASDLVIRGEVLKAVGKITDDDLFVYSIYTILVLDVFRTSAGVQVEAGNTIEMTGPGGIVDLDAARRIEFLHPAMLALNANDQYILHLKHDSEAGDFYHFSRPGIFTVNDGKLQRMDALMSDHFARRARFSRVPTTPAEFKAEISQINCN
jgi:hypothetical protein